VTKVVEAVAAVREEDPSDVASALVRNAATAFPGLR
jgi:Tat protein secretion system quality control protein TatD with DNase activity